MANITNIAFNENILQEQILYMKKDDKQRIPDVRILMNDTTETNIEIQLSELAVRADRSLV